jgi:hypothetical protein
VAAIAAAKHHRRIALTRASIKRYCSSERYRQPVEPHRMTGGGSSWPSTFRSSVRPSVSSAPRVSSGRPRGLVTDPAIRVGRAVRAIGGQFCLTQS